MKNKMIILGALLLFWGLINSHRLEPELRVYPLAMGFDLSEQGYEVYYDMPDLSSYTGEGKPMETSERIWHLTGTNSQMVETKIAQTKKETPDMGHVQVILFGKNLLNAPDKYAEVLSSFVNNPVMGSGAYVFTCEDMDLVMKLGAEKTDSLGSYLVDLIDKLPQKEVVVLQDLYNVYYNQENMPKMMEVFIENDELVLEVGEFV